MTINLPTNETHKRIASALESIAIAQAAGYIDDDWRAVGRVLKSGNGKLVFNAGDTFIEKWKDTSVNPATEYTVPMHVAHIGKFETEGGIQFDGLVAQWHYATTFGIQFSRSRAFYACPDGLAAGTYHVNLGTYTSGKVTGNQDVSFTIANAVPEGGRLAMNNGLGDQNVSAWKVDVYAADGKTILETITPTFDNTGTDLGTMHATQRNGNLNCCQEVCWGCNSWKLSALRQWLNSNKTKGNWWTPQDGWDIAPNELPNKDGFLCGVSEELLGAMQKVKVTTYKNTVTEDGAADVTYDKVFIPSLEQMYCNPQIAGEGEVWDYWKVASGSSTPVAQGVTNTNFIHYGVENHASAQTVRLRSAYRGNSCITWSVNSSGLVTNPTAYSSFRCAPACVIGNP